MMTTAAAPSRHRLRTAFFGGGLVLFVGGIVAMIVDKALIVVSLTPRKLPVLPDQAYTASAYRPPADPAELANALLIVFLGVAVAGAVLLIAAISLKRQANS